MHPILTVPNPILRAKSKPIRKFDAKLEKLVKELEDTLVKKKNPQGVGLSAVQIGTPLRIFATYLPDVDLSDRDDLDGQPQILHLYINPHLKTVSRKFTLGPNKKKPILEGCLSIPGIYGPVLRHEQVKLRFTPVNQVNQLTQFTKSLSSLPEKTEVFSGFTARVIQHELDHLDGILFTDRALKQNLPIYEEINDKLQKIQID